MAKPGKKQGPKETVSQQKVTPPAAERPSEKKALPVADYFDNLGNKGWLAALAIVFVIAFIVFKDYLLFDKVYLFKDIGSDTLNGLYPYVYYTAGEVSQHHFPTWSYSWGIGQNIFALLFRDPFDIFIFLGGKDHVAYGLVYKEFAKVVLGGLVFYFYLKKLKLSNFTSIVGCAMFAFCGFMIVGGGWSYFSYEAFSMALLLLAFEMLLTENKWLLFPIAIFIIAISTPVNLYLYGLFLACYAVVRCFQVGMGNLNGIIGIFMKMAGLGLLGVLLCAPFVIENIFIIMESPRGSGGSSYAHILSSMPMFDVADKTNIGTCVMRFFASDLLGSGNEFKGWQNILEAPMFYCGLPCLLLMPQVFRSLSKPVKWAFIIFIGVWMLPIIFPYFRWAFWLFTGDYYRAYSFFVSLIFLFYSLHALEVVVREKKLNLIVLIVTVVVLFILLNYPFFDKDAINTALFTFVCFLLLVYGALLYFMTKPASPVYLKYIFLGVVVVELMYFSSTSVNQRDAVTAAELQQRVGYNDYTVDAVKAIKGDNSFYRVDKNFSSSGAMHQSLNDGLAQGFHPTSSYNSFNQGNYINYLQLMGLVDKTNEFQTRWAMGLLARPILESENRVKYIIAKPANFNQLWRFVCDSIGMYGDVRLLRNKYVLPIGYTYGAYIKESVFTPLLPVQKDFVSLRACVVADKDAAQVSSLKEFRLQDTVAQGAFTFDLYAQYVRDLSKDTLVLSRFDEHEISGKIDLPEDKMMYLTIPYDAGWTLDVDGHITEKTKLSAGMTGIMLKKGSHKIALTYHQRYLSQSLMMTLLGVVIYLGLWFWSWRRKRNGAMTQ